jgi:repressor LexA
VQPLTDRQQKVLDFIRKHHRKTGFPPTSREIQLQFGFKSQTAAMNHLRALERKGAIRRIPGKARAMIDPEIKLSADFRSVPLVGVIPAGMPIDSDQSRDGSLGVDSRFFGIESSKDAFALRVRGDSMVGAQIADGDTVILVRRQAKDRDIVAALIDGEVSLKRYTVKKGRPFLKAENPDYPDLIPAQELVIQGVMVGLVRRNTLA